MDDARSEMTVHGAFEDRTVTEKGDEVPLLSGAEWEAVIAPLKDLEFKSVQQYCKKQCIAQLLKSRNMEVASLINYGKRCGVLQVRRRKEQEVALSRYDTRVHVYLPLKEKQ